MTQNSNPDGVTLLWLSESPAWSELNCHLHLMKLMIKTKPSTLCGVLISNPNVIFLLTAKPLISCTEQYVVNGGGMERSDRAWVFMSSLHCWQKELCFAPCQLIIDRNWFLNLSFSFWSDLVLCQLCCATCCLFVRLFKFMSRKHGFGINNVSV